MSTGCLIKDEHEVLDEVSNLSVCGKVQYQAKWNTNQAVYHFPNILEGDTWLPNKKIKSIVKQMTELESALNPTTEKAPLKGIHERANV